MVHNLNLCTAFNASCTKPYHHINFYYTQFYHSFQNECLHMDPTLHTVTSIASQQTYLHRFNYGILFNKQFDIVNSMSKWQHIFAIPLKEFEVPFNISFSDLYIGKLAQKYNAQCSFYWEILHSMNILD